MNQLKGSLGNGKIVSYDYDYEEDGKKIQVYVSLCRVSGNKKISLYVDKRFPDMDINEHIEEICVDFNTTEEALDYIRKNTKLDIDKYIKQND